MGEVRMVAPADASASLNLGFLTVLREAQGYLGGYLVTNRWGRPLEFRLTTAVQPNRVQQILYGGTLQPYLCADLIGKALVEKTATAVRLILTDLEPVLELRRAVPTPVAWLGAAGDPPSGAELWPARDGHGPVHGHRLFPEDADVVRDALRGVDGSLDLAEPFARIREAIAEARKLGVTGRG
jgi:hypothetical protein